MEGVSVEAIQEGGSWWKGGGVEQGQLPIFASRQGPYIYICSKEFSGKEWKRLRKWVFLGVGRGSREEERRVE